MAHRTPHDAAQDITAAFVRGQNTVRDQKRGRAQVIGDHPMRGLLRPIGVDPRQLGDDADQRLEQVDGVIVVRALQNGRDPLEPHAGVDRRPREIDALAALELLVLHEHEIPDLDEAVAFGIRRAGRTARNLVAVVVENFRARSARTGIAHGPEIVRAGNAQDLAIRQPRDLLPKLERVVIVDIDRDQQPILGKREILRDECPGELDRLLLEVVAEGEVAEHLEEGVVARRYSRHCRDRCACRRRARISARSRHANRAAFPGR